MAELTFRSAGVSTREIDLSGPTPRTPQGVPAGIIGTSVEGPAFVPLTFASFTEFVSIFGETDGAKFGPLAVNEWMRNARAGTYIRVLGAGDGKKRDSGTGIVSNAGMVVGDRIVQPNGRLGDNPYANPSVDAVASKLVLTIGNGSDTTVPAASDQVKFTAGDGTHTDLTITLKFNSGGTDDTAVQSVGTRSVDFESNILTRTTPTLITNALFTALNALTSAPAHGVDLSKYTIVKDISNANACTITLTANSAEASKYDLTYTETGGSFVDTNNVLEAALTSGVTHIGGIKGRTYFLGTFMSESNGSTIFSDAGIQKASGTASVTDFIDLAGGGGVQGQGPGNDWAMTITVPRSIGGTGAAVTIKIDQTTSANPASLSPTANEIFIATGDSSTGAAINDDGLANILVAAINGDTATHANRVFLGSSIASGIGVPGVTAKKGATSKVTLTSNAMGVGGNLIEATRTVGAKGTIGGGTSAKLTGGSGGAVPILRGVVLAPSGVILHLSGNRAEKSNAPIATETARGASNQLMGIRGGLTGSVDLASQEFVMMMNGFKGTTSNPTVITASFDMTAPNYFKNVFNTDPFKIEEKGHLLYGSYDIYPGVAKVTGSGIGCYGKEMGGKLDIGFLLSGSQGRESDSYSSSWASYEDFQDRYSNAESPFVTSQGFDNPSGYDLFKVVALDAGQSGRNKFKISIENLTPQKDDHGTFDLVIRKFNDTDDERKVLESFRGLSLDPGSDRYIGRAIGDQNIFFNFDNDAESQKIIVDGVHPVKSRYVRVELSNAIKKNEVPVSALPVGFRGPKHLNTSGSLLSNEPDSNAYILEDLHKRVVEPPFPMRRKISKGTGLNRVIDTRLYWGMQSEQYLTSSDPSRTAAFDDSIKTYCNFFPSHRKTITPFSIGNNPGVADLVGGTVLDCDRFNNNRFSLEKIKVVTSSISSGKADPTKWKDAVYVRDGNIVADAATYTRKFMMKDLDIVSNRKFAKFTLPMQGGFDGTNIFDKDKFSLSNNAVKREIDDTAQGELSGPTISAYRKAVDIMGSKTDAEIQLLAIPGIRHSSVTDYAISAVESRFDALYIMDIEERDRVNTVITSSVQNPHVLNTVNDFKNRALDSSFAAAYFPDLTVVDPRTGGFVQTPPSVAVLGAYAINDTVGHPWTAPAGFTRGALSTVEMSSVTLNRENLDDLYDADINPITSFPGTGITVWGQKTVLQGASALDRVNVRRLLIDVRRKVRNIANTLLFEPNRTETLEKFSSLVNPVLQRVQEQSGVDRYKVIIDTTTTTQADVENNTIRGKIFLQPTRTVEFVALDFVVTNAGSELL